MEPELVHVLGRTLSLPRKCVKMWDIAISRHKGLFSWNLHSSQKGATQEKNLVSCKMHKIPTSDKKQNEDHRRCAEIKRKQTVENLL